MVRIVSLTIRGKITQQACSAVLSTTVCRLAHMYIYVQYITIFLKVNLTIHYIYSVFYFMNSTGTYDTTHVKFKKSYCFLLFISVNKI